MRRSHSLSSLSRHLQWWVWESFSELGLVCPNTNLGLGQGERD